MAVLVRPPAVTNQTFVPGSMSPVLSLYQEQKKMCMWSEQRMCVISVFVDAIWDI